MGKFKKGAGKAFAAVRKAATGLAIAGAAAIIGFATGAIKNFADLGDELDKMSQRTGLSVENLGALKFAAEQSGTDLDTVEKAARRMADTIYNAGLDVKTATDALDAIGLSVEDFQGLTPDETFDLLANAIGDLEDPLTKAAVAQDIFGKAGNELLPFFNLGADGMQKLKDQALLLGVVMSTQDAKAAADFKDSLNELKTAVSGLGLEFASNFVPRLTEILRLLVANKEVALPLVAVVGVLGTAILAATAAQWLWNFAMAANPIGLIVILIFGFIAALVVLITQLDTVTAGFKIWGDVALNVFRVTWDGIKAIWRAAIDHMVNYWKSEWNEMMAIIQSASDFIMPIVRAIVSAANRASRAAESIRGGIRGGIASVIPGMAAGGTVMRSGTVKVGERGPELVSLPRGAQVRGAQVQPLDGRP